MRQKGDWPEIANPTLTESPRFQIVAGPGGVGHTSHTSHTEPLAGLRVGVRMPTQGRLLFRIVCGMGHTGWGTQAEEMCRKRGTRPFRLERVVERVV